MKTATLALAVLSLTSSITFAKVLANMQVVCVEKTKQEIVRAVYLTDDKTVLIADPISHLLIVEDIQQPAQDTVLLKSTTTAGTESLQVKDSGDGILTIIANNQTTTLEMTCYASDKTSVLNLSSLKNL
jgi:hypothetical protein